MLLPWLRDVTLLLSIRLTQHQTSISRKGHNAKQRADQCNTQIQHKTEQKNVTVKYNPKQRADQRNNQIQRKIVSPVSISLMVSFWASTPHCIHVLTVFSSTKKPKHSLKQANLPT